MRSRRVAVLTGSLYEPHMEPDRAPCCGRADLDQITHLVGQPEAAAAFSIERWLPPAGERRGDAAAIADLVNHPILLAPDRERPVPAAMAKAVGDHFVDRQHQLRGAKLAEPGPGRLFEHNFPKV